MGSGVSRLQVEIVEREAVAELVRGTGEGVLDRLATTDREGRPASRRSCQFHEPAASELGRVTRVGGDRFALPRRQANAHAEAVPQRFRGHIQDAARCVGAIESGARPAHELDRLVVLEWKRKRRPVDRPEERARNVSSIDEHRHPPGERIVEPAGVEVEAVDVLLGQLHPGRELHELRHSAHANMTGNLLSAYGSDRGGRLRETLAGSRCRYDRDVLEENVPVHHLLDFGGRTGVDPDRLGGASWPRRELDVVRARRHAGEDEATLRVGERPLFELDEDHLRVRNGLAVFARDASFDSAVIFLRESERAAQAQSRYESHLRPPIEVRRTTRRRVVLRKGADCLGRKPLPCSRTNLRQNTRVGEGSA